MYPVPKPKILMEATYVHTVESTTWHALPLSEIMVVVDAARSETVRRETWGETVRR